MLITLVELVMTNPLVAALTYILLGARVRHNNCHTHLVP